MYNNKIISPFKQANPFEQRKAESVRINDKYKNRIPIIVELHNDIQEIKLDKVKYLVPHDLTVDQFMYVIRKRTQIKSEQALFVFFSNTLPHSTDTMGSVYERSKDRDGFLYALVSLESVFG